MQRGKNEPPTLRKILDPPLRVAYFHILYKVMQISVKCGDTEDLTPDKNGEFWYIWNAFQFLRHGELWTFYNGSGLSIQ